MALLITVLLFLGGGGEPLSAAHRAAVVDAYHALGGQQIAARRHASVDRRRLEVIDVSDKVRSASFGHTTELLVDPHPQHGRLRFFVHFGKSTNTPAADFGPFFARLSAADAMAGPGTAAEKTGHGVPCGKTVCPAGEYCCNPACGLCARPGVMCIQQVCPGPDGG